MAQLSIIFWRDIPAQLNISLRGKRIKRELSDRFQKAIDQAAMQSNAYQSDSYLAEWHRGPNIACGDNLEKELNKFVLDIERKYTNRKLKALSQAGGYNKEKGTN